MIRKKGIILIENIFAIAIIITLILVICQTIISKNKWKEIKSKQDEFTRITYALEEEIKYNLSIDELKNLSENNIIYLENDNILKLLTTERLDMIDKGNDIVIIIEDINSNRVRVNICLNEEYYGNTLESKRIFVKDSAMNEYYK